MSEKKKGVGSLSALKTVLVYLKTYLWNHNCAVSRDKFWLFLEGHNVSWQSVVLQLPGRLDSSTRPMALLNSFCLPFPKPMLKVFTLPSSAIYFSVPAHMSAVHRYPPWLALLPLLVSWGGGYLFIYLFSLFLILGLSCENSRKKGRKERKKTSLDHLTECSPGFSAG